ncbi:hypothetical protein B0H14DRAFT_3552964 [Mycena olivaceomarginata]|nr:hypothetical protein B0H14DRAFT_3552964 [Mycena olivaceomarginata]
MCSDVLPTGFECGVLSGRVKPGSSVAIIGGGPISLGIVLTAQLYSPSSLIMITRDPNRLKIAASLGMSHCITFGPSAAEEVMALTGGRGADTVIEAAGVPGTFDLCQELVAVGGTIANLGVHGCKRQFNFTSDVELTFVALLDLPSSIGIYGGNGYIVEHHNMCG